MPSMLLSDWISHQQPCAHTLRDAPVFIRNLEEALDARRKNKGLYTLVKNIWKDGATTSFCSSDCLALDSSGRLRKEYENELSRNREARLGSSGSRVMDGNYEYIESVEREIADRHGVEAALIVSSARSANHAVMEAIPRPGDAIVFDELVHASTLDSMSRSLASERAAFTHNDVEAFRDVLQSIRDSQPLIRQGLRCVLVAIESFYSMDGDMAPLYELVQVGKEIFPAGNVQFIVDEAYSIGVVGKNGLGFVHALGMDSEVAIKVVTYSKAFGSIGGAVLCNNTVKNALLNFSRSTVFTCAPTFSVVAAIRAGYALMSQPETEEGRAIIQSLVTRFFSKITAHPIWEEATERELISIPVLEDWESRDFQTQVVMLCTRDDYAHWIFYHLDARNFTAFPITHPVVPKGNARLRLVFRADHTPDQIDCLVSAVCEWLEEMIQIENRSGGVEVPWAARLVQALSGEQARTEPT